MKSFLSLLFLTILFSESVWADCTLKITVNGTVSVATTDYVQRAIEKAQEKKCDSILLNLNSPGGHLQSTRLIVEDILASPIPFLCLVTPAGGHAGSAGAIIILACHINGGVPATSIGAATPIVSSGENIPSDLRQKMINDTVSWLEGIAKLRGRNEGFSKEIVTAAKSLTMENAHKIRAVDFYVNSEEEFLEKAQGAKAKVGEQELEIKVGPLVEFMPDMRHRVLKVVADPEIAYLMFMGSLALIYFEVTHPGTIVPGVLGGMGLILSLVAFHKLEVVWGAFALIILGVILLVAEIFVTSFGMLGLGGLVSFIIGSTLLFDTESTGYELPLMMIFAVALMLSGFMLLLGWFALKTMKLKKQSGMDVYIDAQAKVVSIKDESGFSGQVEVRGETWNFVSTKVLKIGDTVRVQAVKGLTLSVNKEE